MNIIPKSLQYGWTSMQFDVALLRNIVAKQIAGNWKYALGAKIPLDLATIPIAGETDCSGEVRYLIHRCAGVDIPDGSANQHEWVRANGFKASSIEAGRLQDGGVRVAFLTPADGGGIGHVALIMNGATFESHGGKGPDTRPWTGSGWQAKAHVYVLQPPR